ncbi:hypothetical protein ABVK25_004317 [Lepraria finkii]|uniref:Uncharacterized protein n=1 Tax=Lepraria finkii TaxID=1340010 RepID=A0ABR4BCC9_9LECA
MTTPYNYGVSASSGIAASPRRHRHAVQPPNLLTTSLENARASLGIGASQTPISTTSLSSPFAASAYPLSPNPASPGSAMRGTSPMTFRSQAGISSAYNPQHWGPVGNEIPVSTTRSTRGQSSRTTVFAPQPVGPDEPVTSPPPPYSPRRDGESQDSPRRPADVVSPSDTISPGTESSHYGTPVSAATTLSPDFVSQYPQGPSPVLRQHATPNDSPNASAAPNFPPPPPATQGQRIRSSSKNHADRLLSSLTSRGKGPNPESPANAIDVLQEHTAQLLAQAPEGSRSGPTVRAPTARRAASTGALGLSASSSRSASHSRSPVTWEPGMPLPPPPPGPPPAAARSQSLDRPSESPINRPTPTLPLRARRPPGNGTTLDTVPPTPADWREEDVVNGESGQSQHTTGPTPLHIDTGSILYKRRSGFDYPQTATGAIPAHMRRDSSTGGLLRSPAVRNRSAKGIRERRSESRNGKCRAVEDSAVSPTDSAGPWAENFETVKPMDLILPDPQLREARQRMLPKSTPKSGKSMQSLDGALNSADFKSPSSKAVSFTTSNTTPQPESSRSQRFSASASTPVLSPSRDTFSDTSVEIGASPPLPPKPFSEPLSPGAESISKTTLFDCSTGA